MLGNKELGRKIIPLSDVVDIAFAKADMIIHRSKPGPILRDEDLDKVAQTCEVQGTVSIGSFPKYR